MVCLLDIHPVGATIFHWEVTGHHVISHDQGSQFVQNGHCRKVVSQFGGPCNVRAAKDNSAGGAQSKSVSSLPESPLDVIDSPSAVWGMIMPHALTPWVEPSPSSIFEVPKNF